MKNKSAITIISVALNVLLFCALAYFNKINSVTMEAPAPFFVTEHLNEVGSLQIGGHEVVTASIVK